MKSFFLPALYPLLGLRWMFRHKSVLRRASIPLLLNAVIFMGVGWIFYRQVRILWAVVRQAVEGSGGFFLAFAVTALAALVFGVLVFLLFGLAANVLSAPFHEGLTMAVERTLVEAGETVIGEAKGQAWWKALVGELAKILMLASVAVPLTLLLITPVVGAWVSPVGAPLLYAFTAWFCGFEFVDIAWARRAPGVRARLKFLFTRPARLLTFGLSATFFLSLPVINLVMLPACVVGATLLYHRHLS